MINITKEFIKNFKVPNLLSDADSKNINIDEELTKAYNNKDITKDQQALLKQHFNNDGNGLVSILEEFRKMRINYLMSLEWDDLDKQNLLDELKGKYLLGFQQKYNVKFGKQHLSFTQDKKKPDLKKQIELQAQFVIDNKDETPDMVAAWKQNFKDDPNKLLKLLKEATQKRIDELMSMEWSELDKDSLLPELKKKYFDGFKSKYKQKFGIDYKE
jgi:hypothetical protein